MSLDVKKKVMFILPSLAGGGAEKVAVQLLTHIDRKRYTPILVLFEMKGKFLNDIPSDILIYDLKKQNRFSLIFLIWELGIIIKETSPSVLISFLIYANFVSVLARIISRKRIPLIISEHSVPLLSMRNEKYYFLKKWLYKLLYSRADKVITVTKGVQKEMVSHFGVPIDRINVIYNAVDLDKIRGLADVAGVLLTNNRIPKIISIGRLSKPKGYPYLLKAIQMVIENVPVHLFILGDGEEKQALENLTEELNISKFVTFVGFQENPYKYIAHSDIFVQASLWESFGITLIEAMACGVPVISSRCPYGPEEIITDGVNGLLVPNCNERGLSESILFLLKDKTLHKRLAEEGRRRARDFKIENMLSAYEKIFGELIT